MQMASGNPHVKILNKNNGVTWNDSTSYLNDNNNNNNNSNNKLIYIASEGRNFRDAGGNVMRSDVYATVER